MLMGFDKNGIKSKLFSALAPMVLLGCSTVPLGTNDALAQQETAQSAATNSSNSEVDSQLMFELMIAELAGRRGQLDVAMSGYLSAADRTDDPRVSERATRLAMFGRQWGEAERVARRWMTLDPDNEEAPLVLAQALLRQEKVEPAIELYTQLLNEEDNRRGLLRSIQFELQRAEDPSVAVQIMQSLTVNFAQEPEAHLGLARALITNNASSEALVAASAALEVDPGNTDALLLHAQILSGTGQPVEAIQSLEAALTADSDNTELRLGYAQVLVESGRYEQAAPQLDRIRDQVGSDPDTLLTLSLLAIDSRRLEQARDFLTQLKSTGEHLDQSNFYLARVSDEQKNYAKAIELYDEVGDGDLKFTSELRAAELTALVGDLEQGRERLARLSSLIPSELMQPRLVTTESRMLQNAGKNAEAVEVLSEGLVSFPENGDLLYARALAAHTAGDDAMMVDDLQQLIEIDQNNAHALNALGYHYADTNIELEQAEVLLEKAISLLPDDPAIMDSLGWLRYRQGRYDEAVELLQDAYKKFPDPEIAAHLGEVLWVNGQQGQARTLINAALELNPEDEKLLSVISNVFK